ncbi:MAG: hypothetical protein SGBAC_004883 [Bacillariaceae sp.]
MEQFGSHLLKQYVEEGDLTLVQDIVDDVGPRIADAAWYTTWTPLHSAVVNGHVEVVKWLLTLPVDTGLNVPVQQLTPLQSACDHGHSKIVKCLLENGADIQANPSYPGPILTRASLNGHLEVVKLLVAEKYVDVNESNYLGKTALRVACEYGHLQVVKFLVDSGARSTADCNGNKAPLNQACAEGHLDIVKWLVWKGDDVHAKESSGDTPLHSACFGRSLDVVQWLVVEKGADIRAENNDKYTAFTAASKYDSREIFEWLVNYERVEALSLLECALWKSKLQEHAATMSSMETGAVKDMASVVNSEDRSRCRVQCGADVVVVNVLHFLGPEKLSNICMPRKSFAPRIWS